MTSWNTMISRSAICDKVEDVLALEIMASELYKEALEYAESQKFRETLARIMNDESEHIKLVREIPDLM